MVATKMQLSPAVEEMTMVLRWIGIGEELVVVYMHTSPCTAYISA